MILCHYVVDSDEHIINAEMRRYSECKWAERHKVVNFRIYYITLALYFH